MPAVNVLLGTLVESVKMARDMPRPVMLITANPAAARSNRCVRRRVEILSKVAIL